MALESNHNFRLDQMVWAQFSDNGGFWPAIISRDKKESQKRWCIENNIHVQFISPPFVRACGQVIKVLKPLNYDTYPHYSTLFIKEERAFISYFY